MFEAVRDDCRYALRGFRRSPGFTAVVVLTLALGIGANTAIFSLLDGVMFKPLDVSNVEDLFLLQKGDAPDPQFGLGPAGRFSYSAFQRLSQAVPAGASLAAMSRIALMNVRLAGNGAAFYARTQLVSGGYFATFEVAPSQGRLISDADNLRIDSHPVAVISHAFWQQHLGGSRSAVGQQILVNSVPFTVIGVAAERFKGVWVDGATDLWIPVAMQHATQYRQNFSATRNPGTDPWMMRDDVLWLMLVARSGPSRLSALRAALILEQSRVVADVAGARGASAAERESFVAANRLVLKPFGTGLSTLRAQFGLPLYVLMAMVILVLLIACANIANLLLARSLTRSREMAVRMALGASRTRLMAQPVVECALLSALGCAAGIGLSAWIVGAFAGLTQLAPFSLDRRVFGFSVALGCFTGLACALGPALRATTMNAATGVATGSKGSTRTSSVAQMKPLLIGQVALAVVLTAGAMLFGRTLANFAAIDPGFERESLVNVWFNPAASGYSPAQLPALHQRLLDTVIPLPGVVSVAFSECALADGCRNSSDVRFEGYQPAAGEVVQFQSAGVGPRYFETVGMQVVEGRSFEERDVTGPVVAVVNETIARKYFRGRSAIGQRMSNNSFDAVIIGVVRDARTNHLTDAPVPMAFGLAPDAARVLQARVTTNPEAVLRDIQRSIARAEPGLAVERASTIGAQLDRDLARPRLVAYLAFGFGVLALVLASVGLYGVMAYSVARRKAEIGVRAALGADPGVLIRMVLRDGMRVAGAGIVFGIVASVLLARALTTMLFQVSPGDSSTYLVTTAVVVASVLLASYLPARQAADTDPIAALKAE